MMLKFDFRRENDMKEFKHIAFGFIPAASIAPKAAVPRSPPPRSPSPSPQRPRSALAAAILSSSLMGQTWAVPPARLRSFSEADLSESYTPKPNFSPALYSRGRLSEDRASQSQLSSPSHSAGELEDREEEVDDQEDGEEHVYQSLDRQKNVGAVCDLPAQSEPSTPPPTRMSSRRLPLPATPPLPTDHRRSRKNSSHLEHTFPQPSNIYSEVKKDKKTHTVDEQNLLGKRRQRPERERGQSRASSSLRSTAGSQLEVEKLRQRAQELTDENDALKLTVHNLNEELSRCQANFRPLFKQESSKIRGLPKTGSPPSWTLNTKDSCPLLPASEDRMNEQDVLLLTSEEEVKELRIHAEEVIKENERLSNENAKISALSHKDCQQLQHQAFLVLQENQVLIDQLEAQDVKAEASQNRHQSEVTKMSKQLMLLEAEKQRLQDELEESKQEVQKHVKQVQTLQAHLKGAITWEEHCSILVKLRRDHEQQESSNRSEMDQLFLRLSSIQEENRSLALDNANLTADVRRVKAELELFRQTNRKAERRMRTLKRQKEVCMLKEEKTQHYLGAVISLAEHISKERDHLLHMASVLQQEKQRFVTRILHGTVQFGELHEEIKVYRKQASTRLAALKEEVEGRTVSYQSEILHLQRLLRERQEAEEKLLQSKREVEVELEVVWQAATRENQQMSETLLDLKTTGDLHGWAFCGASSPGFQNVTKMLRN